MRIALLASLKLAHGLDLVSCWYVWTEKGREMGMKVGGERRGFNNLVIIIIQTDF